MVVAAVAAVVVVARSRRPVALSMDHHLAEHSVRLHLVLDAARASPASVKSSAPPAQALAATNPGGTR